jgi:7-cyano-7-deazaguanine reductase
MTRPRKDTSEQGRRARESPLGRRVEARRVLDPAVLFPIARAEGRRRLGLAGPPPFFGFDVWNAYELSWLDPRGKPCIALATFVVPADSATIVESKSLKLYLNSFAGTRFASRETVHATLESALRVAFGGEVAVALRSHEEAACEATAALEGECLDDLPVEITDYTPNPARLSAAGPVVEESLVCNLLKSNCPVTGQPDWGSVQVRYRGPRIDREGLLRYVVSFREHDDFHEHCVERMFVDLADRCAPERLAVYARYTRRGGIDINPFRSSVKEPPPPNVRTPRQ